MNEGRMSFGDHLDELRKMIKRILIVLSVCAIIVFYFKEEIFALILYPRSNEFLTFRAIERLVNYFGGTFTFEAYNIQIISIELSSQFMMHVEVAFIIASLITSPYIIYELFKFISPALYENERKYSISVTVISYLLFLLGILMNYFILFPIAFRFLATYQVDVSVVNKITISSYISTFATLSFALGVVFELPVLGFILGKIGILRSAMMKQYRRHSLVAIMLVSALITPPDIFTLCLLTIPLYLLYEVTIRIVANVEKY